MLTLGFFEDTSKVSPVGQREENKGFSDCEMCSPSGNWFCSFRYLWEFIQSYSSWLVELINFW